MPRPSEPDERPGLPIADSALETSANDQLGRGSATSLLIKWDAP